MHLVCFSIADWNALIIVYQVDTSYFLSENA